MTEEEAWDEDADYSDAAYVTLAYKKLFYKSNSGRSNAVIRDGYFEASRALVVGIVEGKFREEIEGVAAVFLFRHYLELSLKSIIYAGRWLKSSTANAEEIERLNNSHHLGGLWEKVLTDAMPKIDPAYWKQWDIEFVRQCVLEFNKVDPNGEAYRYSIESSENYLISFAQLAEHDTRSASL